MAKVIELRSGISCVFPGLTPIDLQNFSKGTGFDKEISLKYSFPELQEEKGERRFVDSFVWSSGVREEEGKVESGVRVGLTQNQLSVEIAGEHSSCDRLLEEVIELIRKYNPGDLPLDDCLRFAMTNVKVQMETDTLRLLDPKFLEVVESIGQSIYSDERLAPEIQPYELSFAMLFRLRVPESDIIGKERAKLRIITDNPLHFRVGTTGAAAFENKIFMFSAPLRSEVLLPVIEEIEKLHTK